MATSDLQLGRIRRNQWNAITLALTLALLVSSAILLVFYFEDVIVPEARLANGLVMVLGGCCVLPWWMAKRRSTGWTELIVLFSAWYGLTYAVKAFVVLWRPFSLDLGIPFLYRYNPYDSVSVAVAVSLVGLLGTLAGYYMPIGKWIAGRSPILRMKWQCRNYWLIFVFLIAGLGSLAGIYVTDVLLASLPASLTLSMDFILRVCLIFVAISVFFSWKLAFQCERRRDRTFLYVVSLLLTAMAFSFALLQPGKAAFLQIILAVGLARYYSRLAIRISHALSAVVIMAFLVFPLVAALRATGGSDAIERASGALSRLLSLSWEEYWTASFVQFAQRMDSFNSLSAITEVYPRIQPFLNGQGILRQFADGFLPRFVWTSKPITDESAQMNMFVGGDGSSASAVTLVGDLYRNFGVWGVFSGMMFIGVTLRWVYQWCMRMISAGNDIGYVLYLGMLTVLISGENTFAGFYLVLPRMLLILLGASLLLVLLFQSSQSSGQRAQ
ncbi:MAG: hypothetical protein HY644_01915 [Acidobacteria bacterium]|nr:hypothetical protein [Acidobacteriota bacterium]